MRRDIDILIIGGGAAGTSAAEVYRAGGGKGNVLIVSDESHPLYSRVLLPHATKGIVAPEKVFLKKPEFYAEKDIALMPGRSVVVFDADAKTVRLDDGTELSFDKVVIAVGGKPRVWKIPGGDGANVLRLQTYEDIGNIQTRLKGGASFAIVGSGFIALEFAAIAAAAKAEAVLLNRGDRFWSSVLGPKAADVVEAAVKKLGIEVRHCAKVAEADLNGLRLEDGSTFGCDAIGVGIGVDVPVGPFEGLGIGEGILADTNLETSKPDIWTAGDCAEFIDETIGGIRHVVGNWANAVAQGRHVGRALLGERAPFKTLTQYTSVVVPGANLIFMGETRMLPGVTREETVLEDGKKIIELHHLDDRVIGAVLVNCPSKRAEVVIHFTP